MEVAWALYGTSSDVLLKALAKAVTTSETPERVRSAAAASLYGTGSDVGIRALTEVSRSRRHRRGCAARRRGAFMGLAATWGS